MKFTSYFYASLVAAFSIVAYAIYTKEQFYPTILFLVTSKASFVIMGNMVVALTLLLGKISNSLFLGTLRENEIELLVERSKYTFTETCLALTVFRNELSPAILALFGALLFLKAFHWLSSSRLDYMEQVMPVSIVTHLRLISLIIILAVLDTWITMRCISYTVANGRSVLILFGFEFGLLIVSVFNILCRYILHVVDSRLTAGLVSKGLYLMLVDLICDAMKFVTYVFFFCLVFVYYGLPIHIIREVTTTLYCIKILL
jgi:E3 ubiquitin-protein ligase synoviolin